MNSTKVKHGFKFKQGPCKNKINTINKISHSLCTSEISTKGLCDSRYDHSS